MKIEITQSDLQRIELALEARRDHWENSNNDIHNLTEDYQSTLEKIEKIGQSITIEIED